MFSACHVKSRAEIRMLSTGETHRCIRGAPGGCRVVDGFTVDSAARRRRSVDGFTIDRSAAPPLETHVHITTGCRAVDGLTVDSPARGRVVDGSSVDSPAPPAAHACNHTAYNAWDSCERTGSSVSPMFMIVFSTQWRGRRQWLKGAVWLKPSNSDSQCAVKC